jgi:hypothetical protein
VPFLEEVTGLRYYPPATYLVDEAIVTGLRPAAEPDARGAPAGETPGGELPELPAEQDVLVKQLDRLLSVFHRHGNRMIKQRDADARHVSEQARKGFARNVRLYLAGRAPRFPVYAAAGSPAWPNRISLHTPTSTSSGCSPSSGRISAPPITVACLPTSGTPSSSSIPGSAPIHISSTPPGRCTTRPRSTVATSVS